MFLLIMVEAQVSSWCLVWQGIIFSSGGSQSSPWNVLLDVVRSIGHRGQNPTDDPCMSVSSDSIISFTSFHIMIYINLWQCFVWLNLCHILMLSYLHSWKAGRWYSCSYLSGWVLAWLLWHLGGSNAQSPISTYASINLHLNHSATDADVIDL